MPLDEWGFAFFFRFDKSTAKLVIFIVTTNAFCV